MLSPTTGDSNHFWDFVPESVDPNIRSRAYSPRVLARLINKEITIQSEMLNDTMDFGNNKRTERAAHCLRLNQIRDSSLPYAIVPKVIIK